MMNAISAKNRLRALAVAGAIAVLVAASFAREASSDGRTLVGSFCGGLCMSLAFDEATTTSTNRTDFELRPGTYWLTVTDANAFHNFSLRSADGTEQEITTVAGTPGPVTVKVRLGSGWYRLFCNAPNHENLGMYVDFEVGGSGQVD